MDAPPSSRGPGGLPDRRRDRDVVVAYWKADCLALATGATAVERAGELKQTLDALYGPGRSVADAWVWDVTWLR